MTNSDSRVEPYVNFVRRIASQMIRFPGKLAIEGRIADDTVVVEISGRHEKEDHPKLVGAAGKNILALTRLLAAYGRQARMRTVLELMEPPGIPVKGPLLDEDEQWDRKERNTELVLLLTNVCCEILPFQFSVDAASSNGCTYLRLRTTERMEPEVYNSLCVLFQAIGRSKGRRRVVIDTIPQPNEALTRS